MEDVLTDESFGFIPVLKVGGGWRFLLIKNTPLLPGQSGHWSFPKGHKEKGEGDLDVARRELMEETGISSIDPQENYKFYEEYTFKDKESKTIKKKVTYFLCIVFDDAVDLQEEEVMDYKWVDYEDALKTATYDNARSIIKQSYHILNSNFK